MHHFSTCKKRQKNVTDFLCFQEVEKGHIANEWVK